MLNKNLLIALLAVSVIGLFLLSFKAQSNSPQPAGGEYKVITTVESIVPMGLGRSRIIEAKSDMDYNQFTTERTSGKDSNQGKIKRGDAKVDNLAETKMLNFYSGVGLNFQNIASNDAMITSKLNEMKSEGWNLLTVVSGVESDAGKDDGKGIFITRYIFTK